MIQNHIIRGTTRIQIESDEKLSVLIMTLKVFISVGRGTKVVFIGKWGHRPHSFIFFILNGIIILWQERIVWVS